MELQLRRKPTVRGTTFGDLFVDGAFECYTLEDEIREVAGEPVAQWKADGYTAIPAGRYRVTLENSPRFGPDTLTVHDVPGFAGIRIHGGNDIGDTEGCPLVGDQMYVDAGILSGGTVRGVLKRLKAKVKNAIEAGEQVSILILNP